MYKKGEKMICVNDSNLHPNSKVVKGNIYTLTEIAFDAEGNTSLLFNETNNGTKKGYPNFFGYRDDRFIKVNNIENLTT